MKYDCIYPIVFSPTGTSRKTAEAIVHGFGAADVRPIDLTHQPAAPIVLPRDTAALIAVPVYGGKVAPTALQRIEALQGDQTPVVLVVLYGNRSFGSALKQLAETVQQRGFIPVAAAACVGEHSFSTEQYPIAPGRPDRRDLAEAEAFGQRVAERLRTATHPTAVHVGKLRHPASGMAATIRFIRFVVGHRRQQKRNPVTVLPHADAERCIRCGRCVTLCPTAAIAPGAELQTDPRRCIRCAACAKGCPTTARTLESPFAPILARCFSKPKPNVYLTL